MKKNIRVFAIIVSVVLFMSSFTTFFPGNTVSAATSSTIKEKVEGKILYSYEWKLLDLVNKERAKRGLSKFKMSESLNKVANRRAAEISVYYSHKRPNGGKNFDLYPWRYAVGENLAINQKTAKKVLNAWMKSFSHKKSILNKKYKSIGLGCFYTNNNLYWVQFFVDNRVKKNCEKKADCKATYNIDVKRDNINTYQKRKTIEFEETDKQSVTLYQYTNKTINNYDFVTPLKADCVKFTTDNEAVALVDRNGNITPMSNGEATITAYVKGAESKKAVWTVRVALPHNEDDALEADVAENEAD